MRKQNRRLSPLLFPRMGRPGGPQAAWSGLLFMVLLFIYRLIVGRRRVV